MTACECMSEYMFECITNNILFFNKSLLFNNFDKSKLSFALSFAHSIIVFECMSESMVECITMQECMTE
jgi:hypothetical protein